MQDAGSDLDDEAMFKLDEALAAVFRSRVKDKKADKEKVLQLKHFKLRCVCVCTIFGATYLNRNFKLLPEPSRSSLI